MKAMIFAAGMGTRLQPLTLTKPKALVEVDGVPLLEIIIRRLKKFGFLDVVINVHHFAEQILLFLDKNQNFGINIHISDEQDVLLDTGGGLLKARDLLSDGEPVLIHNVDILSNINLTDLYQYHLQHQPLVTMAVKDRKTSRSLLINPMGTLCGWKNNQTGEIIVAREDEIVHSIAFSGIHVVNPQLFSLISERGVFSIIQPYLRLAKQHTIATWQHDQDFWVSKALQVWTDLFSTDDGLT